MKQSERNLLLIDNFLLFVTHISRGDKGPMRDYAYTAEELYQLALEYIEEDHVDGKPADEDCLSRFLGSVDLNQV